MNPDLVAAIGALVVLLLLCFGRAALWPRPSMDKRLAAYRTRTEKRRVATAKKGASSTLGLARGAFEQLRLLRGEEARKINDRLAQAGWRSRDAIVIYLVSRIGAPFAGVVWFAFLVSSTNQRQPSGLLPSSSGSRRAASAHRFMYTTSSRGVSRRCGAPYPTHSTYWLYARRRGSEWMPRSPGGTEKQSHVTGFRTA